MKIADITTGVTNLMTVMGTVLTGIGDNAALMVGAGAAAFRKIKRSVK